MPAVIRPHPAACARTSGHGHAAPATRQLWPPGEYRESYPAQLHRENCTPYNRTAVQHVLTQDLTRANLRRLSWFLAAALIHILLLYWLLTTNTFFRQSGSAEQYLQLISPLPWEASKPLDAKVHLVQPRSPHIEIPQVTDLQPPPTALPTVAPATDTSLPGAADAQGKASSTAPGASNRAAAAVPRSPTPPSVAVLRRVQPLYPRESVSAHEQGDVVMDVWVDTTGHPTRVEVAHGSGYKALDQSAVEAVRQWIFSVPEDQAGGESQTTVEWQFELSPPNLAGIGLTILPFDTTRAARIRTLTVAGSTATPRSAEALREIIQKIQAYEHHAIGGPLTPMRTLASWGNVLSLDFLGTAPHGLEIQFEGVDLHADDVRWEHYQVTQTGGSSQWLIAVTSRGTIKDAQAMICAAATGDPTSQCR
jgi:periplasmic protein TonB